MLRSTIASRRVGGPKFRVRSDRILIEPEGITSISQIAQNIDDTTDDILSESPVSQSVLSDLGSRFENLGFRVKELENSGTIVLEVNSIQEVISNIESRADTFSDDVVDSVEAVKYKASSKDRITILDGIQPGELNFNGEDLELEARIRDELSDISLSNPITDAISEIRNVFRAELLFDYNTPGPRNLNIDPNSSDRVVSNDDAKESDTPDLGDILDDMGMSDVWEIDTGENVVCAVFDTSFSNSFISDDRIIDTYHPENVDSAFSSPSEGHGTMTAYSMAGNENESDIGYSGVAKDADLLLARLTGEDGGISYTHEAWDWLSGKLNELSKPVISNHSYGVPLCSARQMDLCNSTSTRLVQVLNQRDDHQAFYAAGNEAKYCGHRLSGVTNGIAGPNSDPTSITSGAFRSDISDAQRYSSHGFGTCSSFRSNPKPDVGSQIPGIVPYGDSLKDLSTNGGGSQAGTSEASPIVAGVGAIIASITGTADRDVIEGILEGTATQVRPTQVNLILEYDARFGHGQVNPVNAAEEALRLPGVDTDADIVDNRPPAPSFTLNPSSPAVGDEIELDASNSSDVDGDIVNYIWDFGDGTEDTGEVVSHIYESSGQYQVRLLVTDDDGESSSVTANIMVSET